MKVWNKYLNQNKSKVMKTKMNQKNKWKLKNLKKSSKKINSKKFKIKKAKKLLNSDYFSSYFINHF